MNSLTPQNPPRKTSETNNRRRPRLISEPKPLPVERSIQKPPQSPAESPADSPADSHASKLTGRQERFCQNYVMSANAAMAAHEAGYAPRSARKQGYRLMTTRRIGVRIGEIQAHLAEANGRHLDVLIGKLEVVYRGALENRNFAAATRAIELQARLTGKAVGEEPDSRKPES